VFSGSRALTCASLSGDVRLLVSELTMKFRTCVSLLLLLTASTYCVSSCTGVCQLLLYTSLVVAALLLLWSTCPKDRVQSEGKAVFITGCDSGFGNDLARRLDKEGYHVFAGCLALEREGARALKAATSDRLKLVSIDVTDDFQVSQAVSFVKENIGDNELWAVVNNAGIAVFCEIEWCSVQEFMKIMDVNVFGIVRVTKAFLPLLRQSEGRVVNVASLAGRFTLPAFAAYSMSKKACIAFSDGLRQEMKKFNIKVITIEPGLYKTPIAGTNYLKDYNMKSWAETPTEVKDDYGEEYFDTFLKEMEKALEMARPNLNEVVDNMVEAVCVANPCHRYVPYWKSRLRAHIISYLPAFVTDKLFAARFKDLQKVPTKVNKSPRNTPTPTTTPKSFWNN